MNPKMKSAIEKITLNDATFSNEVIEPTYVNFFSMGRMVQANLPLHERSRQTMSIYSGKLEEHQLIMMFLCMIQIL